MIHYDLNEVTELTRALVAIRSFPGEEHAVQQYIVDWFAKYHIATEVQPTKTAPNIIVRIENGDGPTIMLNGHTDTVLVADGWECDPFEGKIDGDNFYGLGACDMKSGVAAIMLVTREMFRHKNRWSGTLIFSSVVDEEAYSVGAYALIESGIKADYCIVSEPMQGLVLGASGKVLVKADVIGKAAHGFMPWQGVNAASEGSRFVVGVDQLPLGKHERIPSSQSVLSFLSGSAQYVVTIP
jgi:acetylornithine deacetylase/succinyl-diaminopimelate desuccinylase-like protein